MDFSSPYEDPLIAEARARFFLRGKFNLLRLCSLELESNYQICPWPTGILAISHCCPLVFVICVEFLSAEILLTDKASPVQNIYYGCLYAYTPEVLPSAHRGTGNGISIGLNRLMGIMSAVIETYVSSPS